MAHGDFGMTEAHHADALDIADMASGLRRVAATASTAPTRRSPKELPIINSTFKLSHAFLLK